MVTHARALLPPRGPPERSSWRRPAGWTLGKEKRVPASASRAGIRTGRSATDGSCCSLSALRVQQRGSCTHERPEALKGGGPRGPRVPTLLSRRHHLPGGHVSRDSFLSRRACQEESSRSQTSGGPDSSVSIARSASIVRSVSAVGVVALACKMLGLIREVIIAASFGVGWVSISVPFSLFFKPVISGTRFY